ncbi:MAG: hypothetical protein M5R42_20555 [Rhodocyclaceae bacterium]|nr:hypothetical protein [Rhodocyclaceae bacterium]
MSSSSGSKGSSTVSFSMNMWRMRSGDSPFASPAAMKPPELTPT